MSRKFESFRREYTRGGLSAEQLDASPLRQFEQWLEQAVNAGLSDPTAMSLSTIDAQGRPWQRIVLLKGLSDGSFVFYTNHASDKAMAIAANPQVSLLFPWNELDRQVIVGGVATKMSLRESASYFLTRPRESQIAPGRHARAGPSQRARCSRIKSVSFAKNSPMETCPCPTSGEVIESHRSVSNSGREVRHRLHDRFRYECDANGQWRLAQLQP